MGAKGAVEIIFRGQNVEENTADYEMKFANPMVCIHVSICICVCMQGRVHLSIHSAASQLNDSLVTKAFLLTVVIRWFVPYTGRCPAWICGRHY